MTTRPAILTCRSCGARIYFATTVTGGAMPIDAEPVEGGNIVLTFSPSRDELTADVVGVERAADLARQEGRNIYTSHFATCPNAEGHRCNK